MPMKNSQPPSIRVVRVRTDTRESAYVFSREGSRVAISYSDVHKATDHLWTALDRIGFQAITRAKKQSIVELASDAPSNPQVIAATRIGYGRTDPNGPIDFFAFGDGQIITCNDTSDHIALFRPDNRYGQAGDAAAYLSALAPILRDQSVPLLLFMMTLAPILQPFAKEAGHMVENVIVEVRGETTVSKSLFMTLVTGSVWGGGDSKLGYAMSWNKTENRLEEVCAQNNNTLLIFDETTLAGRNATQRSEAILQVLHRISIGVEKDRMNQAADPREFSVIVFSTSNENLQNILQESPQVQRAAEVRLLSIPIPDRVTDIFDRLPDGFADIQEVYRELISTCRSNYGHLGRAFIRRVLRANARDHGKLIRSIRLKMDVFLTAAEATSGTAYRTAKPFALAYAAGVMAKSWGIFDSQEWGSFKKPLLHAYAVFKDQAVEPNAVEKLESMLRDPKLYIIDSRLPRKPVVSDRAHQQVDGYQLSVKGQLAIGMTTEKVRQHLGKRALQELSAAGRLVQGDRRNSALVRVRRKSEADKPLQDRLHLILPLDHERGIVAGPKAAER